MHTARQATPGHDRAIATMHRHIRRAETSADAHCAAQRQDMERSSRLRLLSLYRELDELVACRAHLSGDMMVRRDPMRLVASR